MKEIAIISGKGGTGKTTIAGAFMSLAENCVGADCDVDSSTLFLILKSKVYEKRPFIGIKKAKIKTKLCNACCACYDLCQFGAITMTGPGRKNVAKTALVDRMSCEGCNVCVNFCSIKAIEFNEEKAGSILFSKTKYGPIVHAKLNKGSVNSAKLVNNIKNEMWDLAEQEKVKIVIIDGPPGIGSPVISTVSGADIVLIVSEPTVSGISDLKRAYELATHLGLKTATLVNKSTLNESKTDEIKKFCDSKKIHYCGEVPYDETIVKAMVHGSTIIEENPRAPASLALREVWNKLRTL